MESGPLPWIHQLAPVIEDRKMMKTSRARKREVPLSPVDHVRGSPLAKVTLIGYGDFSNPDCTRTYRTVKKIQKKMGSRMRYIFRCFPEPRKFANSEPAAEAVECASSQGKFWEMHDRMFENQCATDEFNLARCAKELGLDLRRFRREMSRHVHLAKVRAGRKAGVRRGVVCAPTFFINSSRHESSFGMTTLLPAVQAAAGGS
jgi:protein-disulfide isomerase